MKRDASVFLRDEIDQVTNLMTLLDGFVAGETAILAATP
jgi:hypothetical protein